MNVLKTFVFALLFFVLGAFTTVFLVNDVIDSSKKGEVDAVLAELDSYSNILKFLKKPKSDEVERARNLIRLNIWAKLVLLAHWHPEFEGLSAMSKDALCAVLIDYDESLFDFIDGEKEENRSIVEYLSQEYDSIVKNEKLCPVKVDVKDLKNSMPERGN